MVRGHYYYVMRCPGPSFPVATGRRPGGETNKDNAYLRTYVQYLLLIACANLELDWLVKQQMTCRFQHTIHMILLHTARL